MIIYHYPLTADLTVQQGGNVSEKLLQVGDAGLQPDEVLLASLDLAQSFTGDGRARL